MEMGYLLIPIVTFTVPFVEFHLFAVYCYILFPSFDDIAIILRLHL